MSPPRTRLLNYAAYQIGWLAAVGGAAGGWPTAGAVVSLTLTGAHVVLAREREREAQLVVAALLMGLVVERALIAVGTYRLLAGGPPGAWPPLWLLALWGQFATTWRYSLAAIFSRPWRAALFGAVGGPLAFVAGERVGAVVLWAPVIPTLSGLAVAWSLALAALALTNRVVANGAPGGYRG